jgi:mannose-1-phosphate guanylyltransferase
VFRKSLEDAIKVAQKNASIVTMGVVPNYPSTGFGYIQCGQKIDVGTKTEFFKVKRFVEKPSLHTAQKYLRDGGFYWNSGMFIWRVNVLESAFASVAADIGELINKVVRAKSIAPVLKKVYPTMRPVSFDYGVMEKIDNILVAKSEFLWDDVGSWIAVENHFSKDYKNNVCLGKTMLYEVSDTVVVGEDPNHLIAMIGVKDIVVVHTKEATLICAKEHVQDIKKLLLQNKINGK